MPTSNFQPIRLLDPDCCHEFAYLMANRADPDQLASESGSTLFAKQDISGFSRTMVKTRMVRYGEYKGKYRIQPNYCTVRIDFSKLLGKLALEYVSTY